MLRFAANISLLFKERPFLERFAAAREAGFTGVEIQFPYDYPARVLASAADQAGMPIVLINAPVGRVRGLESPVGPSCARRFTLRSSRPVPVRTPCKSRT